MKKFSDRRGSAIILALIFAAAAMIVIVSQTLSITQQYETTLRYGLGQSAFHLSESGLELAMHAITEEEMGTDGWAPEAPNLWKKKFSQPVFKGYDAATEVYVYKGDDDIYTITALTGIDVSGEQVESAVEIKVKQNRSDSEEEDNTGSGVFGYGLVAKDSIKLNHNNPGMRIASYNSDVNYGVPIFGENTGYAATVATPSANNGAININNAFIHGAVRSGGGSIGFNSGYNNPNQQGQNATVIGEDSGMSWGVDQNRMSSDFDGEVTDPTLPVSDGYTVQNIPNQNYWKDTLSIGSWNQPTWIETERIDTRQQDKITISGDVVMNVKRNLNLAGDIEIQPGATLTIIAGENIHVTANEIDQQHPAQFQIIAKANQWGGAPDVVLNNFDVFSGIINAPNSNVRLAGVGGTPKSQFRGAIVAKYIEVTNGAEFYYDVNLGNPGDEDDDDDGDEEGIGDLTLLHWAEIPPKQARESLYNL